MSLQTKHREPLRRKGLLETLAEGIADGLTNITDAILDFFDEPQPSSPPQSPLYLNSAVKIRENELDSRVINKSDPLVREAPLSYEVKQNLSIYEDRFQSLILKTRTKEDVYTALCINMPESLVQEMVVTLKGYIEHNNPFAASSYEEIMKSFMEYTQDIENIPWCIARYINAGSKLIDYCIRFVNKFTSVSHDTLDLKVISMRPYALALIWAILMLEIVRKYTGSCVDYDLENIARLSISLVLSLFAGFTGFMHSGGRVGGVTSPTRYLRLYYNVQKTIEENYPYHYYKIPDCLKFRNDSFESLISSMQISAGKGLSMAYTFRIGDALIENLLNCTVVSDDVMERTFKSIWPVPSTYECQKMYRLYTESQIYYK